MLELIFRGFIEWIYGLILESWEYFSSGLLDIMSLDFSYLESHMPILPTIRQIMLGASKYVNRVKGEDTKFCQDIAILHLIMIK